MSQIDVDVIALGRVVDEGRGSLPFALVHGEALVTCATWALSEAGVLPLDARTTMEGVHDAQLPLVLHDSLCPMSFRCDVPRGCLARALVHDSSTLFEIDLPSGDLRRVGMFPISLNDIALAPDGTFYGASTEAGGLVRVDYVSVTYEIVAPVFGSFNALDVAPDGTIYGAADDVIYAFDLASGAAREVARMPPGLLSSGDLAFVEGRLYVTGFRDVAGLDDTLVGVDLASGRSVAIGSIGYDCVWALAPLGPALYGLTCNGHLLELDLRSGRGRELSVRPEQAYWGAASR